MMLRPGEAGASTAADSITVIRQALAQRHGSREGRRVLVRVDGAGITHHAAADPRGER